MFRAASISLVLMGTGLVGYAATHRGSDACAQARAAGRPDAEAVCASSRSSSSSSHYYGGSGGARATSIAAGAAAGAAVAGVSRGGFGSSGAHASSGGS